jgi:hypothetical protein
LLTSSAASAQAFTLLKIAGALYLIWLGLKTWREARAAGPIEVQTAGVRRAALRSALFSLRLRRELGLFGRKLVEQRFSLTHAAKTAEEIYLFAIRNRLAIRDRLTDAIRCTAPLASHKLRRKYHRWTGSASHEDGNDRARISNILLADLGDQTAPSSQSSLTVPRPSAGMPRRS